MKSNLLKGLLVAVASLSLATGCLKDKGFENQQYGVDLDKSSYPQSVSIPAAANGVADNLFTVDLRSTPQDILAPTVVITTKEALDHDVVVNLVRKDSLVLANNQNINRDYDLSSMPATAYTIPSLKVVIPAGQRSGELKIVITDATKLSVSETYGFGFQIASVDQAGFHIAGNLKNVLIGVNVANKYDGVYRCRAFTFLGGNTTAPYLLSYPCNSQQSYVYTTLTTSGADRVDMAFQPVFRNGGITAFTNVKPTLVFDVNTNKVTNVVAQAGSTGFTFPWAGAPTTYNSRYDPATKTIYVQYGFQLAATWYCTDTLVYCGPR